MKTYIIQGASQESLDELLERETLAVTFRARHIPMLAIETEESLQELQEAFPDYTIRQEKEYHHNDRRPQNNERT